jgi:hypothetical protein
VEIEKGMVEIECSWQCGLFVFCLERGYLVFDQGANGFCTLDLDSLERESPKYRFAAFVEVPSSGLGCFWPCC